MSLLTRKFPWIVLVSILVNLFFTWAPAHEGDQGFWINWIQSMQDNGLAGFNGNYPPVYTLWLWFVAQLTFLLDIPLQQGFAIKFLCLWPVFIAQVFLLRAVHIVLKERPWSEPVKSFVLWGVALNPALLLDGPVWGQVDLVACVFVLFSLWSFYSKDHQKWALPLYVFSLLIKFQMIAFLPVIGALAIRRYRIHWKGLLIGIGCVALFFLPFLFAGKAGYIFEQAYLKAAGTYPYATFNAGNVWMILLGNTVSVNALPFTDGMVSTTFPMALLTGSWLGKILFSIISLAVFLICLRANKLRKAAMFASLLALSFFFLLPEMHERYLLPAVPLFLFWMACDPRAWPFALLVTVVAGLNINMIHTVNGDAFWLPLSWLCVAFFLFTVVRSFLPSLWNKAGLLLLRIPLPRFAPEAMLGIVLLVVLCIKVLPERPSTRSLDENQIWLSKALMISSSQEYRSVQFNRSVEERPLRVAGKTYRYGIGTHAPSRIEFRLSPRAKRFQCLVGMDDEASGGRMQFIVELDGHEVWRSESMIPKISAKSVDIDIQGSRTLTLITDPLGDKASDHADWLEPIITEDSATVSEIATMEPVSAQQSWGKLQKGLAVSEKPLRIGTELFENGLGTHASSRVLFNVPSGVCGLQFLVGVDEEVGNAGKMMFAVSADGQRIWTSDTIRGSDPTAVPGYVNLVGKKTFQLEVDSLEDNKWDHADWVNLQFKRGNCE